MIHVRFFDRHIDTELPALGGGSLPPRRWRRVIRHARSCHRCATLYGRAVHVLRQLENQSPLVPAQIELSIITAINAPGRLGRAPVHPAWPIGVLAAVAAAVAFVVLRPAAPHTEDLFAVRGSSEASVVALRVFCGGNRAPLSELREGASCSVGQSLAFAAGARPTHRHLALEVSGSAAAQDRVTEIISAQPGAEAPVGLTVRLERPGTVDIVVAFAAEQGEAETAARGAQVPSALVLRRTVKVVP